MEEESSNHMQRPTTGFYASAPAPTEFDPEAERALATARGRKRRRTRIWYLVAALVLLALPGTIISQWVAVLFLGLAIAVGSFNMIGNRLPEGRRRLPTND